VGAYTTFKIIKQVSYDDKLTYTQVYVTDR